MGKIKISKRNPSVFRTSEIRIKQKIDYVMSLGYTHQEVISMSLSYPKLLGISEENMKNKIDDLLALDIDYKIILSMVKKFPALLALSTENIYSKLRVYKYIGIIEIIYNNAMCLMQSADHAYARYSFLKENGILITPENYKLLFIGNIEFASRFKITKEELLEKYKLPKNLDDNREF